MALENIFEKLLELPLFQGMSHNDLNQVVAHTKFGFLKIARNKAVVSEGDTCQHIYFLTSGSVKVESRADDGCYSFTEKMTAPDVIQPERLFGLTQRYTKSFTALEECSILRIDKQQVLRLIAEQEIFRLNLLNIISTQSQRISHQPWRQPATTIRQKIVRFVESRSLRPAGPKTLHIRMEDMARLIAESRLNLSRELNKMHDEGIINITRGEIHIPALEKLIAINNR